MIVVRMFAAPAAHALTPAPVVRDGPTRAGPVTVARIPDGLDVARTPVVPAAIVPIHAVQTGVAPMPAGPAETVLIRAGLTHGARAIAARTGGAPSPATIRGAGNTRSGVTISIATNAGTRPSAAGSAT